MPVELSSPVKTGRPALFVDEVALSEVRHFYETDGLSLNEVAGKLGVSAETVRRRMKEAGVQLRSRSHRSCPAESPLARREKARVAAIEYRAREAVAISARRALKAEATAAADRARNSRPEKKAKRAEIERSRRDTPRGSLNNRMSCRVRGILRGSKSGASWQALVGYTVDQLRTHIERQFVRRMGWHNMHLWHVDHIIPLSSFSFSAPEDDGFKAAWALTNLRPMWAIDNIKKSNKRLVLL